MRALLVSIALLPALCAAAFPAGQKKKSDSDAAPAKVLVEASLPSLLPYQQEGGLLVVKAAIGDGEFANAILDTGLPTSTVSPKLAEKQGIKPEGQIEIQTVLGNAKGGQVKGQNLRLGTVTLSEVPFVICDLMAHLSAEKKDDAPPIWLGASAIAGLAMTIDPAKQTISFLPASAPLPQGASVSSCDYKDGRWYVDVRINNKKTVRALLDTGAVGMLLPSKLAKDLGLTSPAIVATTLPSGKEGKVALVKLAEVSIGSARANSVPAIYVTEGDTTGMEQETAVVGTDFLLRFKVTIHFPRKKIAFEPLATGIDLNAMRLINGQPPLVPGGNPTGVSPVNQSGKSPTPARRKAPVPGGVATGGGS